MPEPPRIIPIASRLLPADATMSDDIDRPNRAASLEVLSPTALSGHAALSEVAGLRTIPLRLSRDSFGGRPFAAHRDVRDHPCGFSLGNMSGANAPSVTGPMSRFVATDSGHASPCSQLPQASKGDVPLPVVGPRGLIGLAGTSSRPWTDGAPGVTPFAVLLLLAGGLSVSASPSPLAFRLNVLLDGFDRGINRLLPVRCSQAPFPMLASLLQPTNSQPLHS